VKSAAVVLRVMGGLLGFLAGSVLRIRRAHVEAAMRAAGIARAAREARGMYAALGVSALEFLWLAARGKKALAHVRIDDASVAPWREAAANGRGVVVAASHTGNWDLAACAVAREVELLVVTKRLRVGWLDRFWQATRAAQGVRLSDAQGALRRARAVLSRRGAVAMMIDQVPGSARQAVVADFLGRPALVDRAAATLAASAGAPLVVAASRRVASGQQTLHVLAVFVPPRRGESGARGSRREWIDEATVAATRALDRFVRANPSQWLWLHRRWKRLDPTPGAAMLVPPCPTPSSSPVAPSRAA
jgi:KDO2-lipid IV(A) lauroyltransferase